jgi:hypothetical protein
MNKKNKKKVEVSNMGTIVNNCEWCFQFDDDEAIVFANSKEDAKDEDKKISFTLGNNTASNITFKSNDKVMKLFVRERK